MMDSVQGVLPTRGGASSWAGVGSTNGLQEGSQGCEQKPAKESKQGSQRAGGRTRRQ